ncbi:DUF1772 domain-containing protein [Roseofilum sp. BLCC_M91]|uniref:DUF1772 domain-containing protein n=1 Tax=Roseofilum halophilum BLCC-M91 TaxID=3022259 RepID=A0ABT7BP13_9CYAN|nr:DUF1772 domain-containing protein [Roseofilum halophilum]MDJ1180929.1 DUF1772 domain-containing protein [Roseofilum halophilum BLCC-M91]
MPIEGFFQITLILATFLCSLVAGFLLAFAIVVMPGIKQLSDREFIRAFQVIDGIIQNNQPVFVFLWLGSIVFLIASSVLSLGQLDRVDYLLILLALLAYLLGVQLPTFTINIPLNKQLQSLKMDEMDEAMYQSARLDFEPRWNRWNLIRTPLACLVSALLILLLFRL